MPSVQPVVGDPVADVADMFVTLVRSVKRARARFLAREDVDWSTYAVLHRIAADGPMRASDLASALQSDPSTVSRQVAAMVKDGLLERRADPEDGRASILVLTAAAHGTIAEFDRARTDRFATMLAHWEPSDLSRFAELLRRFTIDFENATEGKL